MRTMYIVLFVRTGSGSVHRECSFTIAPFCSNLISCIKQDCDNEGAVIGFYVP